ncbi:DUF1054 domain-containing protein [Bacillus sp. FJAT-47783]|uniref:YktB family protein n=1 Tax=Bacillus sp. FJAT-47783 TaxID=2922712 RepID=UPI001FABBFE1|nr:DUF1054 domain-containing protein [Bacillus sp. FJAT-47783]
MEFTGFFKSDFQTFTIEGLEARMDAIQKRIQPKFHAIGEILVDDLSVEIGNEMFLHIAKHARRTKNPPKDTWLAISANKRGYKQHPHFQLGLWDDHVFLWLAYIYEAPNKKEIAKKFLENIDVVKETIPSDFMISKDHTKNEAIPMTEDGLQKTLERFFDVKKGELLIGRKVMADDPILQNPEAFMEFARETFKQLIPLYKLSYE